MSQKQFIVASTILLFALAPRAAVIGSCPFCSAVSQTLRQEMSQMDTVAIAKMVPNSVTDTDAQFSLLTIIRGEGLVRPEQALRVSYFGQAKPDQEFLLMGVDPPDLLWSSPLPVSEVAIKYIESISKLPEDPLQRITFYLDYLEHPEPLLARDAYDEFASAPYEQIKQLKDRLDREKLIGWIKDTSLPPDRKRLYLVMLGVCGTEADGDLLETLMRSEDPNRRAGLDAMIACYVTLKGEERLKLIDELFLANKDCEYASTYQAIMALRFLGTEGGVVTKERTLESMRLILDRPAIADLVIPDLARWEDWTQIEKLTELFKTADDQSSWVRVPVINYLRACPLPAAEKSLAELKELDPAAFKRATSFFPNPKASGGANDGTSTLTPSAVRNLASDRSFQSDKPIANALAARNAGTLSGTKLDPAAPLPGVAIAVVELNRGLAMSVLAMVSMTLWLSMWLAISGAGGRVCLPTSLADTAA